MTNGQHSDVFYLICVKEVPGRYRLFVSNVVFIVFSWRKNTEHLFIGFHASKGKHRPDGLGPLGFFSCSKDWCGSGFPPPLGPAHPQLHCSEVLQVNSSDFLVLPLCRQQALRSSTPQWLLNGSWTSEGTNPWAFVIVSGKPETP